MSLKAMKEKLLRILPMQDDTNRMMALILTGRPGIGKTHTAKRLLTDLAKQSGVKAEIPVVGLAMAGQEAGAWGTYPVPVITNGQAEIQHVVYQTALKPLLKQNIKDGFGLLILDDVTAADPAIQSALLDTVQFGTIGSSQLGDNVVIALTGNDVTDGSYAVAWSHALRNRSRFKSFTPDFDIWAKHNAGTDASVYAFLKNYEDPFFAPDSSNDKAVDEFGNMPSPRAWSNLGNAVASWGGWSKYVPTSLDGTSCEFAQSIVGLKAGLAFSTFASEFGVYPTGEELVSCPELWEKVPADKKNMLSGAFGVAFSVRSIMTSRFERVKDKTAAKNIVHACMRAVEAIAADHRETISFIIHGAMDSQISNAQRLMAEMADYIVREPNYVDKDGKYHQYFVQHMKMREELGVK